MLFRSPPIADKSPNALPVPAPPSPRPVASEKRCAVERSKADDVCNKFLARFWKSRPKFLSVSLVCGLKRLLVSVRTAESGPCAVTLVPIGLTSSLASR